MIKSRISAAEIIEKFHLIPHIEGGFYKENYLANDRIPRSALPERFQGDRRFSSAIYFLLMEGQVSKLHRIASDEVWHFYLGSPLVIVEIENDGKVKSTLLGTDVLAGQHVQYMVPAGNWFGAYPLEKSEFCFVGCTVAPGFDYADFELASRDKLLSEYPHAKKVIHKLT